MPTRTFENIHNYTLRNNQPWYFSGVAICPVCSGTYRTQKVGNYAVMRYHKNYNEVTPKRRREIDAIREWHERRADMRGHTNPIPTGTVTVPYWGAPVQSTVSMIETVPGMREAETGFGTRYLSTIQADLTFRIELQSQTYDPSSRNYIYQLNGQYIAWPESRMCVTTSYAVWEAWNNSLTVTTGTAGPMIWENWARTATTNGTANIGHGVINGGRYIQSRDAFTPPVRTPAQIEAHRLAEYERVQVRERARAEAQGRAQRTLLELLQAVAPDQVEAYRSRRSFEIRTPRGMRYRIRHGSSGNVDALGARGEVVGTFCAHPHLRDHEGVMLPHEDAMIAQMMYLLSDEEGWLSIANVHQGRRPTLEDVVRELAPA